ncbi:hypothetical protein K435DRAFT_812892 [Dendrothele bispora CBS 962.96]|uniref:Uncharacterized protein n=1 Tax=Dendrothele bispora (strain CBS 962.96) TaxID=1314807 RepID=A0A4S8KN39_DENBC|nr:hypothetical protein K435DRAFT_812892 [Dendrothele bispora CBS 962.96]
MIIHVRIGLGARDRETTPKCSDRIINTTGGLRSKEGVNVINSTRILRNHSSDGSRSLAFQKRVKGNRLLETGKELGGPGNISFSERTFEGWVEDGREPELLLNDERDVDDDERGAFCENAGARGGREEAADAAARRATSSSNSG